MSTYRVSANTRMSSDGYSYALILDGAGNHQLPMALFRHLENNGVEARVQDRIFIGAKCSADTLLAAISIVYTGDPGNLKLERIEDLIIDASPTCADTGPVLTLTLQQQVRVDVER